MFTIRPSSIYSYLYFLGNDPDAIALKLTALGCSGDTTSSRHPISNYLRQCGVPNPKFFTSHISYRFLIFTFRLPLSLTLREFDRLSYKYPTLYGFYPSASDLDALMHPNDSP